MVSRGYGYDCGKATSHLQSGGALQTPLMMKQTEFHRLRLLEASVLTKPGMTSAESSARKRHPVSFGSTSGKPCQILVLMKCGIAWSYGSAAGLETEQCSGELARLYGGTP